MGRLGSSGSSGTASTTGVSGGSGISGGNAFTFSTTTTDADPGQGVVRFNNATQASATILYMDAADTNGVDLTPLYKGLGEGIVLTFRQSDTKWQTFLVQGVATATGYWKVTVVWQMGGTAIDNAASLSVTAVPGAPYLGTLTGDVTALTRNADGTVATITINGLVWTQSYNTNGTLNTETTGGLTRTYGYSAAGVFTGVSGAVEKNGCVTGTWANIKALSPSAAGAKAYASDLFGGQTVVWNGTRWRCESNFVTVASNGALTALPASSTSEQVYVVPSIKIPAGSASGPNDHLVLFAKVISHSGTTNARNQRWRIGTTDASTAGTQFVNRSFVSTTQISHNFYQILSNNNSTTLQNLIEVSSLGNFDSSSAMTTNTAIFDSTVDNYVTPTGQTATAGETLSLAGYFIVLVQGP